MATLRPLHEAAKEQARSAADKLWEEGEKIAKIITDHYRT